MGVLCLNFFGFQYLKLKLDRKTNWYGLLTIYDKKKQTGVFCLDINVKICQFHFKKKSDLELFLTQNL